MNEDRIEKSIEISADAWAVWRLVCVPGWWINDGEVVEHDLDPGDPEVDPDVVIVQDREHGPFAVRTESLRAPNFAAFRWMSTGASTPFEFERSTLVEFEIEPVSGL